MKNCSLSAAGQRRSASAWSISSGVRTFATLRSGDWRHSFSTPSGRERVAQQGRPVVLGAAVGVGPGVDLVGDAVLGDGRPEAVGRPDQPVDHEPAVAQAEHPAAGRGPPGRGR